MQEAKLGSDSASQNHSRTATPVGVPSGDEAELKQWTDGNEDPRGTEEDEQEASTELNGTDKDPSQENNSNKPVEKVLESNKLEGNNVESDIQDLKSSVIDKPEKKDSECDKSEGDTKSGDSVMMETGD